MEMHDQEAGRGPRARLRRLPRDRVHIQAPPDLRLAHPAQPDRARAVRPDADPGVDAEPGDGREQGHLHQAGKGFNREVTPGSPQ